MESTFTETTNRDTGGPLENIRISNVNFSNADVTISDESKNDHPMQGEISSAEQQYPQSPKDDQ